MIMRRIGVEGNIHLISGLLSAMWLLLIPSMASAQQDVIRLKNQMTGQTTVNFDDPLPYQFGLRYIPTLDLAGDLKNERKLDAELSVNGYGNLFFNGREYDTAEYAADLYRFWIRYSTPRLEIRAGLQKISFGSATIFRPLMWFDKLDFRDPLQLTEGVYGLLGRYYFQGNVNIWLWGLYGNKSKKGWELAPTTSRKPEFGGRIQVPLFTGEIALSYNHRNADFTDLNLLVPAVDSPFFNQDYIGIDGKWDIGAGIWFEYVLKHNEQNNKLAEEFEHYLTIGTDYTFDVGSGLNLTTEYFRYQGAQENNYTALALNYPFGLMNRMVAAVYYQWDNKSWYRFISLQSDYDYWSFNLIGFWNPDQVPVTGAGEERTLYAGSGIKFMATVNF
jgi:hypothetical protein